MTEYGFLTIVGGRRTREKIPKGKAAGMFGNFPGSCQTTKNRILLASSDPGDLVVIPFAGSGSEIVSCIKHGRDFIAAEINPVYVRDMILPRLTKEGGDKDTDTTPVP